MLNEVAVRCLCHWSLDLNPFCLGCFGSVTKWLPQNKTSLVSFFLYINLQWLLYSMNTFCASHALKRATSIKIRFQMLHMDLCEYNRFAQATKVTGGRLKATSGPEIIRANNKSWEQWPISQGLEENCNTLLKDSRCRWLNPIRDSTKKQVSHNVVWKLLGCSPQSSMWAEGYCLGKVPHYETSTLKWNSSFVADLRDKQKARVSRGVAPCQGIYASRSGLMLRKQGATRASERSANETAL